MNSKLRVSKEVPKIGRHPLMCVVGINPSRHKTRRTLKSEISVQTILTNKTRSNNIISRSNNENQDKTTADDPGEEEINIYNQCKDISQEKAGKALQKNSALTSRTNLPQKRQNINKSINIITADKIERPKSSVNNSQLQQRVILRTQPENLRNNIKRPEQGSKSLISQKSENLKNRTSQNFFLPLKPAECKIDKPSDSQNCKSTRPRSIVAQRSIEIPGSYPKDQPGKPNSDISPCKVEIITKQETVSQKNSIGSSINLEIRTYLLNILNTLDSSNQKSSQLLSADKSLLFDLPKNLRLSQYNLMAKCLCNLPIKERAWFLGIEIFEKLGLIEKQLGNDLEAIALASLLAASKFECVRSPCAKDIAKCAGTHIKAKHILNTEELILKVCDYRMLVTLSYDYYVTFSGIISLPKKARDLGLFMLMVYHCYEQEYIQEKALLAFSLCVFLSQRFGQQSFWSQCTKDGRNHYEFQISSVVESSERSFEVDALDKPEYVFEVTAVEKICAKITESCLRCEVKDHPWIFHMFASDKYKCGKK
jgi:hypothetical protein